MPIDHQPTFRYLFGLFQPTDPIRVFDIGHHKTSPSHAFGPAVRPYFLLHFIENGEGISSETGRNTISPQATPFSFVPTK